jgi:hypothetical protein
MQRPRQWTNTSPRQIKEGLETLRTVGIPPAYPKLGPANPPPPPHLLDDTYRYMIAIQMLEKSRWQGKQVGGGPTSNLTLFVN